MGRQRRPAHSDFYPRPPRGGRPSARFRSPTLCLNFYPRPPRGGRPELYTAGRLFNGISIHALREEGDAMRSTPSSTSSRFLSTPSARRATACENHRTRPECYFYPRPPRGGRRAALRLLHPRRPISIHALREEGDALLAWSHAKVRHFYPRPPRGGRLLDARAQDPAARISIHALREEGDPSLSRAKCSAANFYPRPPRGGRLS